MRVLQTACANGQLTRAGLLRAFQSLKDVRTDGLVAPLDYSKPGQIPARQVRLVRPDAGAPGGLTEVEGLFVAPSRHQLHAVLRGPAVNIAANLVRSADRYPDRPAVRLDEEILTYADLDESSARACALLREHGVPFPVTGSRSCCPTSFSSRSSTTASSAPGGVVVPDEPAAQGT